MGSGVELITYADRFGGGGLDTIRRLLTGPLAGAFTGVHVLPFYVPYDGADAGFDPIDHTRVDPRLGTWQSVAAIAETHDVMADLVVNHVSDESPQFRDFLERGEASPYAGMFLEAGSVFPDGASAASLAAIYRPRPGLPFTDKRMADGTTRRMWTTFTPHQIDIDVTHPAAVSYLRDVLDRFSASGVRRVRLDAVGYAIKIAGTSCFMLPETLAFIRAIGAEIGDRNMDSLLEIHSHYADQISASGITDWVYDFALPPLLLHATYSGSADAFRRWLEVSPRKAITVLDTHDGIGVIDVGPDGNRPGLLTPAQVDELVEGIHLHSNGESRRATGAAASNLDLYQVNCTYYSALGCDDDRYLLARLAQLLCPGVPQVYYAGLLAEPNAMDLLEATGVGRDINRPYFSMDQVDEALQRPVVQRLLALCRFRTQHPAFAGDFTLQPGEPEELAIAWKAGEATISARIDFARGTFHIASATAEGRQAIDRWDQF